MKIKLKRDSIKRRRVIFLNFLNNSSLKLDFTEEPGFIFVSKKIIEADTFWKNKPKPLEKMLKTFFISIEKNKIDKRLNNEISLFSSNIADSILPKYINLQKKWIKKFKSKSNISVNEHLKYALKEVFQSNGPINETILKKQLNDYLYSFKNWLL